MINKIMAVIITILVLTTCFVTDIQATESKYRLGLQGTLFVGGLSGIVETSKPWAFQAVLDFGLDAAALRALYRFNEEQYVNFYGQGTLGFWDQKHRSWDSWRNDRYYDDRDNIGLGAGIGVEFDWRGLNPSLVPLGWNIELGARLVPDLELEIGLGLHWKFE